MRVVTTSKPGAPSSAPGGKTMKKFSVKRLQSISRRLVTRAFTGTPCTSSTSSSPTATCKSFAISRSSESGTGPAGSGTLAYHFPATSFSVGERWSR